MENNVSDVTNAYNDFCAARLLAVRSMERLWDLGYEPNNDLLERLRACIIFTKGHDLVAGSIPYPKKDISGA